MTIRDELVRAAVFEAYAQRDIFGRIPTEAIERILEAHRTAPLIQYAREYAEGLATVSAVDRLVAERTSELEHELTLARRRAVLAEARIAALEVDDPVAVRAQAARLQREREAA